MDAIDIATSDAWRTRHPDRAWLVIEVARTSQRIDRKKLLLYAAAGVDEVWMIDLPARRIEVHSGPRDGRYGRVRSVEETEALTPEAFPEVAITVRTILP